MIKPNMSNIPGMGAMTDTLDFVKNLWGGMSVPGMGIPGMVMPTLSVEEINKQISDLKAVESWLTLNMNMLRGTIQALEVQSATISTLKSMGESLSAAVKSSSPPSPAPAQSAPVKKPEAQQPPESPPEQAPPESAPKAEQTSATKDAAPGFIAGQANPAVWWNMLQDQFKQAVSSAMVAEPASKAASADNAKASSKPKVASPTKRKPAAKAAPKS